jgi:hypothetical protein
MLMVQTSEHVHKQPRLLRAQNRGNFPGNPKNTFRFRKIVAIFNSLPAPLRQATFHLQLHAEWKVSDLGRVLRGRHENVSLISMQRQPQHGREGA